MKSRPTPGARVLSVIAPLPLLMLMPIFLLSCGSGSGGDAPGSAGAGPAASAPNLQVDSAAIPDSIEFMSQDFSASDCEVQEGCVTETGTHHRAGGELGHCSG